MDYLFRRLAIEYLSVEERAELGIFTVDERMQPTLPGVEESVIETSMGSEIVADPKTTPRPCPRPASWPCRWSSARSFPRPRTTPRPPG
jgi:ribonucleoside-diphosphate reductase alpha chain